jgi:cadmium resistance protein CadD (predicted permease)
MPAFNTSGVGACWHDGADALVLGNGTAAVADWFRVVASAFGMYLGTNVDGFLVLVLLFRMADGDPGLRRRVVAGQFLGLLVVVGVSAVAAAGLGVVRPHWVGLLGLVPVAQGVRGLVRAARHKPGDPPLPPVVGALGVAAIAIGNGGDNLSVYIPALRLFGLGRGLLVVAVFVTLTAVWCALGSLAAGHPAVVSVLERSGRFAVPVVFIGVGVAVLVSCGTVAALLRVPLAA